MRSVFEVFQSLTEVFQRCVNLKGMPNQKIFARISKELAEFQDIDCISVRAVGDDLFH